MRKLIITLFIIIPSLSFAQERVNRALPNLSNPITKLDNATGWRNNKYGQWKEEEKEIPGIDNFIRFEFRYLDYGDIRLLVFIKFHKSGRWKYPLIEEDWITTYPINFYFIDYDEYVEKMNNLSNNNTVELNILFSSFVMDDVDRIRERALIYFDSLKKSRQIEKLVMQFRLFEEKNKAQFLFYQETCRDPNAYLNKKKKKVILDCFYSGLKSDYSLTEYEKTFKTDNLYDNFYYETLYSSLMGLIKWNWSKKAKTDIFSMN